MLYVEIASVKFMRLIWFSIQERQTSREGTSTPCVFRISSEGLPLLLPHMTKQIACATPVDFKHLLQYKSIKFPDLVDDGFREKVATLSLGCCVVVLNQGLFYKQIVIVQVLFHA